MTAVLIIGAGWLGRPLAKQLSASNHTVHVTNSSHENTEESLEFGLSAHQLQLPLPCIQPLASLIEQLKIEVVIGCITPGFRRSATPDWDSYANNWQQICDAAKQGGARKVIMISSTAVYPSVSKDMKEDDASLELALGSNDFSKKSLALLQAEQKIIESGMDYVVIRCSGLVDEIRHPSRFAMRLRSVSRNAPANMLHRVDAVGMVEYAMTHIGHDIINASTPNTCDKAQFYQAAIDARSLNISLPEVVDTPDKQIDSSKSVKLGYQYHFQHTLDLL
ncbi:NAD-dependent epimerase/dehydratase family protein [Vibrio superstes]|uniref:Nucleoside-diphosphate sugar epimerase n=1 Tax=Vibrio superstes NBRC 103154 TaxID=1219062 RepID=A0A511QYZ4_9VIBR|nr:NAD-dependent epimerase/dehydratase family protein [Vibrio superstes]GEM81752.1 nucleoside-diphosphate sugar epimerase [Vibrio superstes NBRC 103154]